MSNIVYLNGDYLPIEQAKVSVMDRGFLLADGVYEVISLYQGKPLEPKPHLERLHRGLKAIGIAIPFSDDEILAILENLVTKNGAERMQSFYLQITRGVNKTRQHHYEDTTPTIFARLQTTQLKDLSHGVKAITVKDNRWAHCEIKGINRLASVMMSQQVHLAGAEEGIIIHQGNAVEGVTSNLFIVEKDTLITPPTSTYLLSGITRGLTIRLAKELKIDIKEETISQSRLENADEIWITSSSRTVAPITTLDGKSIGNGQPGPLFQQVYAAYQSRIDQLLSHL